ncbi:MAG: hypothetical protein ABIF12_01540 [bacterium]
MKKRLILLCILNLFINTQSKSSNTTMPIYFWHQDSGYAVKEIIIGLKQIIPGIVKDPKWTTRISTGEHKKFNINNSKRKKNGYYIDYIKIKYDTESEGFLGIKKDISYKFPANISLADEELEFVILTTKKNTEEKASNELEIYKGYKDRVRADLKRYIKTSSTDINKEFNIEPGDSLSVDNIVDFPITSDNKIGINAYRTRIIKGEKD